MPPALEGWGLKLLDSQGSPNLLFTLISELETMLVLNTYAGMNEVINHGV